MTTKKDRLTGQNWLNWFRMAEGTLIGAAQMVWQNPEEVEDARSLFGKVTGLPRMKEGPWRNSITWSAAVLLALSAEQSMKALAIRRSPNNGFIKTHDLECLWKDLQPIDQQKVAKAAQQLKENAKETSLGAAPYLTSIKELEAIARHHKDMFEGKRYYLETRNGKTSGDLTENIPLWKFALSLVMYARQLATQG